MEVKFDVSKPEEKLTGDALILFEDIQNGEDFSARAAREIIAAFMVDDSGKPMPRQKAYKLFGGWHKEEIEQAVTALMEAFNQKAVPPPSGSESLAQSGTTDALPDGQES